MRAKFWHERWENNQIGFHQQTINSYLQEFWPCLATPVGSEVFVPLCGKSRDMLWLRAEGYKVLGIELSPIAVQDFFAENDLQPQITMEGAFERWQADGLTILLGDFFALTAEQLSQCQSVYDRASLIALPPDMRSRYVEHLRTIMPSQAKTLLVTNEYDQQAMSGPPFAVLEAEVRELYEPFMQVECLLSTNSLDKNPTFAERGVKALSEKIYRLTPRT